MRKKSIILKISAVLFISAVAALIQTSCSRETGKKVVIKGSTTVLPITQKAAEKFKSSTGIIVTIEGSGSGNGIKAMLDGTCDIANSSRQMKDKELDFAKNKNLNIREITAAYDMIIPVAHPSNGIQDISLEQLKAIYDGSISNWKQLGGKDLKIVPVSRDTSSGTYEVWHELVMKGADVRRDALMQASNGAIVSTVSQNPQAIGYIGFGYLNSGVKAIKVNGVEGTIEAGKNGTFKISRKLFMYVNNDRVSPETEAFVKFITGAEGQKLVKEAGFIPVL